MAPEPPDSARPPALPCPRCKQGLSAGAYKEMQRVVAGLGDLATPPTVEREDLIEPDELIEKALRLTANQLRYRCRLTEELTADLPRVRGERSRLVHVLVNLLLNAAQALPEREVETNRVVLRTLRRDDQVVFEVEDNGAGIPAQLQSKVFDPFFTTRDVGEGTGLGLAISHAAVQAHGGTLELESAPGRTCFRVSLPVARVPTGSGAGLLSGGAVDGQGVLVVDDDALVGGLIADTIESSGRRVRLVNSGEAGLAALRTESFDLIVCDVMMPGMSGWEFARRVTQGPPILFVTGGAFTPAGREFVDSLPPLRLLEKPFTPSQLLDRLQLLLTSTR